MRAPARPTPAARDGTSTGTGPRITQGVPDRLEAVVLIVRRRIHPHLGRHERLTRVIHPGQVHQFSGTGARVEPLGITGLAEVERSVEMHLNERSEVLHGAPRSVTGIPIRGGRSHHHVHLGGNQPACDLAESGDLDVVIASRETE